jgi:hypothetical protein
LSLRGINLWSPTLWERKKKFEVWIPLDGSTIIPAVAKTEWMTVEDELGDSPFWIRSGLSLTFRNSDDRRAFTDAFLRRADLDRVTKEQETSKIGFVF